MGRAFSRAEAHVGRIVQLETRNRSPCCSWAGQYTTGRRGVSAKRAQRAKRARIWRSRLFFLGRAPWAANFTALTEVRRELHGFARMEIEVRNSWQFVIVRV